MLAIAASVSLAAGQRDVAARPVVSAGDHDFSLLAEGRKRCYTVHVPKGYDGKTPMPVVVMLHGGGGRSQSAARETGWDSKADEAGFLAVFPNAVPSDPAKPASFGNNSQLWNDGSGRFDKGQNGVDDISFLRAMLGELSATFAVDRRRIYFTGFSNGASMTFRAGAELSDLVAAVAPVAGTCWNEPEGQMRRPVSLCMIAGSDDPLNPLAGGLPAFATGAKPRILERSKPPVLDSVLKWARAVGCPETPTSVSLTNGVRTELRSAGTNRAEVVFITVEGLGHNWAGGASLLPEAWVGKRTEKLKATDVIWAFFLKHTLPE